MNTFIKIFLIIIITIPAVVFGQTNKIFKGFGLEVGAGYNTATWKEDDSPSAYRRNQFWLLPTMRIENIFTPRNTKNSIKLKAFSFIGYNVFGGKSKKYPNGYEDYYLLRSIEFGSLPTLDIRDKFQISAGIKCQYVFNGTGNYYGWLSQPDTIPRQWKTENHNWLKGPTLSFGIRMRYKIKIITCGVESWFGLTSVGSTFLENNYRLLFGIEL